MRICSDDLSKRQLVHKRGVGNDRRGKQQQLRHVQRACDPGNGDSICIPSSFHGAVLVVPTLHGPAALALRGGGGGGGGGSVWKKKSFFLKGNGCYNQIYLPLCRVEFFFAFCNFCALLGLRPPGVRQASSKLKKM